MRGGRLGSSREDVLRLFEGDSVAGLGDGELLARFAARRDEAAFEALVGRLGPMVLGTCRRMLSDPHDVDDAFQATFLVLVRKAGSIRDPDLVAPWLHGVATRIARRARVESARRTARERVAVVAEARDEGAGIGSEWPELRALIDEEIGRLPEHHRRAVVLCDVEGLSREEAALRLGWSLNMVRGRLERARDRLRSRLARRGLAPSGAWAALVVAPPTPPPALLASTTRAALAFSAGRMGAGLASASAVALSQGALRMMMLSKLKIGLAVLLSTGFVAGSGMLAAQGPVGKPAGLDVDGDGKPDVFVASQKEIIPAEGSLAALGKSRIEKARKRLETQMAFYNEGRITIDRLLNASQTLLDAELDVTEAQAARIALMKAHLDRVKEIEKRELAELEVGRATLGDVEEVQTHRLEVEFRLAKEEMKSPEKKPAPVKAKASPQPPPLTQPRSAVELAKARIELALQRYKAQKNFYDEGRLTNDRLVAASRALMEAERDAAGANAARVEATRAHHGRLQEILKHEQADLEAGATTADVADIKSELLDAEFALARELEVTETKPSGGDANAGSTPAADAKAPDPKGLASRDRDQERVVIARRLYKEAERLFPSEIDIEGFLDASRTLFEAEYRAARTKAGRVAALQARVDIGKRSVAATEDLAQKGLKRSSDLDRARLQLLDAESLLIEESSKPERPDEGTVPAPNGPLPGPGPGASKGTGARERSPLAAAIEEFNKEAATDEFGRDREPLTEDEVIAAVRAWKPENGEVASKELSATLDSISEARRLPEGAGLSSMTQKHNGKDFFFYGWWVVLRVPGMDKTRGIMVRQQLVRSATYEEALAKAAADLKGASSPADRSRLEKSIEDLKRKIQKRKIKILRQ